MPQTETRTGVKTGAGAELADEATARISAAEFDAVLNRLVIVRDAHTGEASLGPISNESACVVEFLAQTIEANPALQAYIRARLDASGVVPVAALLDALEATARHGAMP